jgi:uncharacterized membrane protein
MASTVASNNSHTASPRAPTRRSATNNVTCGLFSRWLETPIPLPAGAGSERDFLVHKMSQWLVEHDRLYYNSHVVSDIHEAIAEILDIITNLVGMLKSSSQMLGVIMLYADRFVKRSGIKHNQLFNLLLTSTVVTVKFWNEAVVVSNKNIAQVFEFSLEDVNLMERRFLAGVEYNLCVSEADVKGFLISIIEQYYASNSTESSLVSSKSATYKCAPTVSAQGVIADVNMMECAALSVAAAAQ